MFRSSEGNGSNALVAVGVGISDGLIVPLALTAGLSRVFADSIDIASVGITGAFVCAAAMGLANYYAAKHEAYHYTQPIDLPNVKTELGLDDTVTSVISGEMENEQKEWSEMMQIHGMNSGEFNSRVQRDTALLIAAGYVIGGIIPVLPYVFSRSANGGLFVSCLVTVAALFMFGYFKAKLTSQQKWSGAIRSALIGCVSATAAYLVAGVFI
jgi:VIT1/CCC1 family predicted Fe2+/Mn2+ transporter